MILAAPQTTRKLVSVDQQMNLKISKGLPLVILSVQELPTGLVTQI